MANLSALKQPKQVKGEPPSIEVTTANLDVEKEIKPVKTQLETEATIVPLERPKPEKKQPKEAITFKVTSKLVKDFEKEAAKKFGFKKGSKSLMFVCKAPLLCTKV